MLFARALVAQDAYFGLPTTKRKDLAIPTPTDSDGKAGADCNRLGLPFGIQQVGPRHKLVVIGTPGERNVADGFMSLPRCSVGFPETSLVLPRRSEHGTIGTPGDSVDVAFMPLEDHGFLALEV